MPLYEYKCKTCGHRFDRLMKFSDPPPPCPASPGLPGERGPWAKIWAAAEKNFALGKRTPYPGLSEPVGHDFKHTVIHIDGGTTTKTMAEWLVARELCGGDTERQISRGGSFHLKGGGWYKDGY